MTYNDKDITLSFKYITDLEVKPGDLLNPLLKDLNEEERISSGGGVKEILISDKSGNELKLNFIEARIECDSEYLISDIKSKGKLIDEKTDRGSELYRYETIYLDYYPERGTEDTVCFGGIANTTTAILSLKDSSASLEEFDKLIQSLSVSTGNNGVVVTQSPELTPTSTTTPTPTTTINPTPTTNNLKTYKNTNGIKFEFQYPEKFEVDTESVKYATAKEVQFGFKSIPDQQISDQYLIVDISKNEDLRDLTNENEIANSLGRNYSAIQCTGVDKVSKKVTNNLEYYFGEKSEDCGQFGIVTANIYLKKVSGSIWVVVPAANPELFSTVIKTIKL
jgi:hypothetical protein